MRHDLSAAQVEQRDDSTLIAAQSRGNVLGVELGLSVVVALCYAGPLKGWALTVHAGPFELVSLEDGGGLECLASLTTEEASP